MIRRRNVSSGNSPHQPGDLYDSDELAIPLRFSTHGGAGSLWKAGPSIPRLSLERLPGSAGSSGQGLPAGPSITGVLMAGGSQAPRRPGEGRALPGPRVLPPREIRTTGESPTPTSDFSRQRGAPFAPTLLP
jgi:hypothetical protein